MTCSPRFYGEFCNKTCSEHCTATACDKQDGSCECKVGYAGNPCTECPPNCDDTGCNDFHCHTCNPGFYGDFCNKTCSEYCATTVCDKEDGSCECKVGYAGNPCTECPSNCDRTGCNDDFHCHTCNPGFYGDFCNRTCSFHCIGNRCNIDGSCNCSVGYGGHPCEPCPKNCSDTGCNKQLICHECHDPGFYGDYCNFTCSTNCINGTCNKDGTCNCSVGYGGNPCEPCPKNCSDTGCNEQLICHECDPGFHGDYCTLTCSTNCINGTCNRDGSCICKDGFDGLGCCPENCEGGCSDKTFICSLCKDGYHGDSCHDRCPDNCKNGCTQDEGKCYKCIKGYSGDICDRSKKYYSN